MTRRVYKRAYESDYEPHDGRPLSAARLGISVEEYLRKGKYPDIKIEDFVVRGESREAEPEITRLGDLPTKYRKKFKEKSDQVPSLPTETALIPGD